jgi:hypothetical protein
MDAPVSCFARTPFAGRAFQTPAADLWASCGRAASVTLAALPALGCLPGRSGSLVGQASTASGLAAVLLGAEDQLISRRASQESATVRPASYMACCMPAPRGRQALGWLGSHTALDTLVTPAVHAQLGAPSLCSSGSGQPSEASLASASPRTPRWSLSAGADSCDRPHHRAREMTRGGSMRGGCAARQHDLSFYASMGDAPVASSFHASARDRARVLRTRSSQDARHAGLNWRRSSSLEAPSPREEFCNTELERRVSVFWGTEPAGQAL